MADPIEFRVDKEKVQKWLDRGAKPSDTVRSLLNVTPAVSQEDNQRT
jgi:small subunit ribosomal protein S16